MKTKMTAVATILLLLLNSINAANNIKWALSNLPDGYVYNDFHYGYAVCQDSTSQKYGAIDTNGKIAIPVVYNYVEDFNGDATNVKTNEGEGIIGFDNKYLLRPHSHYMISPITTEIESRKQTFKNSFLVVNTSDSTQAIFYKDKFITDFAPIHSLAFEVQFPFIYIDFGAILNTETNEIVISATDMGSYFITENENGDIKAISRYSGENVTPSIIGGNIWREETREYINSMNTGIAGNDMTNIIDAPNPMDDLVCSVSLENGKWLMTTRNGDIKYSLNAEEGWICRSAFLQNMLAWFERTIPNTDSTQVKIVYYNGDVFLDKTVNGSFLLKFYPSYYYITGHVLKAYSSPHIFLTEISPKGVEVQTTIECIIRGATLVAKAEAAKKKKFATYTFKGGDYQVCGNYLIHPDEGGGYTIYDIEKDKKIPAQAIMDCSDELILAQDLLGKYFIIVSEKGKVTTLSKFQSVFSYNDKVLIAQDKDGKAVIDASGKILFRENENLAILSNQCSEDVVVARNKSTNQVGYVYNPIAEDFLTYNSGDMVAQLNQQGNAFFAKKKYNKAKRCFEMLYKHDPKNIDALIKYADCLTAQKYYSAAMHQYRKALTIDPNNKEAAEHLATAQEKKEREEQIRAAIYSIASSLNNALESTSQALNVSTSSTTYSGNASGSSRSNVSTTSDDKRNNSSYWWSLKDAYYNYENQLSKMKTYPETYNDSDRRYIQSKMKEIRNKLQQSGYTLNKSQWEDWNGK